ncbi:hypothetical protein ACFR9U_16285 [Halorientalis brevis]|uniref:Uncharacterized protein n=1 Tax=Halorientalis brevis TaxID=1126241 RepID=A0ABD6CH40_9EURY|nr:hypothetical protein [Halorientalis brevis]
MSGSDALEYAEKMLKEQHAFQYLIPGAAYQFVSFTQEENLVFRISYNDFLGFMVPSFPYWFLASLCTTIVGLRFARNIWKDLENPDSFLGRSLRYHNHVFRGIGGLLTLHALWTFYSNVSNFTGHEISVSMATTALLWHAVVLLVSRGFGEYIWFISVSKFSQLYARLLV